MNQDQAKTTLGQYSDSLAHGKKGDTPVVTFPTMTPRQEVELVMALEKLGIVDENSPSQKFKQKSLSQGTMVFRLSGDDAKRLQNYAAAQRAGDNAFAMPHNVPVARRMPVQTQSVISAPPSRSPSSGAGGFASVARRIANVVGDALQTKGAQHRIADSIEAQGNRLGAHEYRKSRGLIN